MKDFLTVSTPAGKPFHWDLGDTSLSIGRSSHNDLCLDDPGVSRIHARIEKMYQGYFIIDAGGKNGTFVNDVRIVEPKLLQKGDCVRLGSSRLILNAEAQGRVEIVDTPILPGASTTFISAEELRSSPGQGLSISLESHATPVISTGVDGRSLDRAQAAASAGSVLLGIIFEADKELVFHRPLDEILETIMDLVGRAIPFDRGLLMLLEEDKLVPRVVRMPPEQQDTTIAISSTITDRVVHKQESVLTADARLEPNFKMAESIISQGIRSAMCVPLWDNREVKGLIYIDSRRMSGLFTEDHLRLLTHFANVAAVKIENARLFTQVVASERLAKELEGASEIQTSLLPSESPPISGYLLSGSSVSCRAVGGDVYDYIELSDGRIGIALGDVAGKGLPAALLMCAFQASLRALAELNLPPRETMLRLNKILCRRLPMNRFVTFFYAVLDPRSNRLSYVNAGHCPPWIVHAGGRSAERVSETGRPLGMFESSSYEEATMELAAGDLFVCYSDGVPDGVGPSGEEFGEKKLVEVVESERASSSALIVRRVMEAIEVHHAGVPRQDDITVVVLKRSL